MKLEGSKILVTGASSGIGAALAPILAERGATVGIVARRANRSKRCSNSAGSTHRSHACGLLISPISRAPTARVGSVGCVRRTRTRSCTTAAIPKRVHMSRLTMDDVTETMDINFHSPVRMTLAVLPKMLERKSGTIVWVSSMGGRIPIANESAYNAAKYAMCGFAEPCTSTSEAAASKSSS
jgi:short-subunit dehydrogenase